MGGFIGIPVGLVELEQMQLLLWKAPAAGALSSGSVIALLPMPVTKGGGLVYLGWGVATDAGRRIVVVVIPIVTWMSDAAGIESSSGSAVSSLVVRVLPVGPSDGGNWRSKV